MDKKKKQVTSAREGPDDIIIEVEGDESVTTTTRHDAAGQVIMIEKVSSYLPTGKKTVLLRRDFKYDSYGRLEEENMSTSAGTRSKMLYSKGLLVREEYSDFRPSHAYTAEFTYNRNKDICSYIKEYSNGAKAETYYEPTPKGDPAKSVFKYTVPGKEQFTGRYEYDDKGYPITDYTLTVDGKLLITTYSYSEDGIRYPSSNENYNTGERTSRGPESIRMLQMAGLI